MNPWKLCANCIYAPMCVGVSGVGCLMISCPLSECPPRPPCLCHWRNSSCSGPRQPQLCVDIPGWKWKFGHNQPLNNWGAVGTQKNRIFHMFLRCSQLCCFGTVGHCLFFSLKASKIFNHFFLLKILEPWVLRVFRFVLFYLFLIGFVQKSDVPKLFIIHPTHEFSFSFNFYDFVVKFFQNHVRMFYCTNVRTDW